MANRILTATGYEQRIRDKLSVDSSYLQDVVINQPDYITVAEANIIAQLPDYSGFEDDARVYLEAAVVCECARLLAPTIPSRLPNKESGPHESHELMVDWNKRQLELEAERDEYIGKVKDLTSPGISPPSLLSFNVTSPRRWC